MASKNDISNMALSHVGVGKQIVNIDTEQSQEALACRRFWDIALESTLRDFDWPFAKVSLALALLTQKPNPDWDYAYQYPSDCLEFKRVMTGLQFDNRQTRVPYILVNGPISKQIYTNMPCAWAEYTQRVTDTSRFPPDFVLGLSFRIAIYIAPRLTGGDPYKMGDRAARFYDMEISKAKATGSNEEQIDEDPRSEFIRARD